MRVHLPLGLRSRFVYSLSLVYLLSALIAPAADRTRPTTPTNLRSTAVTSTSVSLAWNPSTDNSGSFVYIVRELNSGQSRTVSQSQTTFTWTALQPNRTYRFVVFARDGAGNQSANSNTLTVNTPATPPLGPPANLRVTGAGLTTISLAWDAVVGATAYQVNAGGAIYTSGAQTSYTVSGLSSGSSYAFTVRAQNGSTFSAWSTPVVGTTLTDTAPPTVPSISAVAISPGVVRVTWTESTDDLSSVGYNVYVNGQPARSMLPDNIAPRTVLIHNLRAATSYQFTVKAYDTTGNFSAASEPVLVSTPTGTDAIAPATPANLTAVAWGVGKSTVSLAWQWAADNVGTMAYEIYMDDSLVGETLFDVHYGGVDTWFTVRQIQPGTTHTFTVKARDEAGNVSTASNPVTVTLLPSNDVTPPSAPFNLWGSTAPGCAFLDFIWNGSLDDVDQPGELEYEIYEDGLFRGMWRGEVFEASFGRHRYHIRAVDRSGNRSAPSNEIELDSGLDC